MEFSTLHNIVSSTAEAETGCIFKNGQKAISICRDLIALGHPQPPTPLKMDNKTTRDIITSLCKPKRSKPWDMRYHWVEDKVNSNELNLHWKPGSNNWTDYFTKHHAPIYHQMMRYKYLQWLNLLLALRAMVHLGSPDISEINDPLNFPVAGFFGCQVVIGCNVKQFVKNDKYTLMMHLGSRKEVSCQDAGGLSSL